MVPLSGWWKSSGQERVVGTPASIYRMSCQAVREAASSETARQRVCRGLLSRNLGSRKVFAVISLLTSIMVYSHTAELGCHHSLYRDLQERIVTILL